MTDLDVGSDLPKSGALELNKQIHVIISWVQSFVSTFDILDASFPRGLGMHQSDALLYRPEHSRMHSELELLLSACHLGSRHREVQSLSECLSAGQNADRELWAILHFDDLIDEEIRNMCGRIPVILAGYCEADATARLAALVPETRARAIRFQLIDGSMLTTLVLLPRHHSAASLISSDVILVEAGESEPETMIGAGVVKPTDLISDVPWRPESSGDYSWHWLGPEILSRFVLGDVPNDYTQLRIYFMPNEAHSNLADNLKIQLNGRPVPFENGLNRLGGHVTIYLPGSLEVPVILGIASIPVPKSLPGETRTLRSCISGIEFY
jgi:hypothetical protein